MGMNREQRRRAARRGEVVEAPGGVRFRELGRGDDGSAGSFGPKERGKHRWGAFAVYAVSEALVRHEMGYKAGDPQTILDHETRVSFHIGCVDCEMPYPEIDADSACPAPPNQDWPT